MAGTKPIRILYMEDDHGLALLFRKKLEPLGYDIEVAQNGADGIECVRNKEYDILIVDFNMPGYNGLEVIRILSTEQITLPTIMLTAAGSEEVAVEALKWGAADYVAKGPGYLDRLPVVIKQTLVHHNLMLEKLAAEDALLISEATNRALLRAMPDYILQLNNEGTILSATPATHGEFFLPRELEGKTFSDIYPADKAAELQRLVRIVLESRTVQHFEFSIENNDSRYFYEHRIAHCGEDRVMLVIRDITQRVEMEQEKEWLLQEFQDALAKIKTLNGLIPICASCKKVRDDKGYWNQIEEYIQTHSQAEFSHGVCPGCMEELYPEHMNKNKKA